MAATSQPLATQAAVEALRSGGTAVDAAIAANAVLCVVEPTGAGLGGDLFATVWDGAELHGLNASGRSPASLSLSALRDLGIERIPSHGPLSLSVPGTVDGWFELNARFGRTSMSALLKPAIGYARDGYPVSELVAVRWKREAEVLREYPGFERTFLPGGRAPGEGEVFRNPELAETLEAIAAEGRDAFYAGEIARTIGEHVRRAGGYLSCEDLADHTSEWVTPVSSSYRGVTLWELPPNGQGIAALQTLNVLEGFDIASLGFGSADYLHLFAEAKKLAYEDRARFYADPAFNDLPVEWLISKEYAEERRALIDPKRAAGEYPAGAAPETGDTICLSVADRTGTMVSLIQSNYRGMGSGLTPEGLGFVLQDRGELFSLEEGHFNAYAPRKRPFHTIIPAFAALSDERTLSFGVMGGAMQPQGHAQILINIVDFGMNVQEAGDAPRVRHTGSSQPTGSRMTDGGRLNVEPGFDERTLEELWARGHDVSIETGIFGGYQAVMRDARTGVCHGASDVRKDGMAAGF